MGYKASGIALLIAAAIIFTIERAVVRHVWVSEVAAVKINGSGAYMTSPNLPEMAGVPFVMTFITLGAILLLIGIALDVWTIYRNSRVRDEAL